MKKLLVLTLALALILSACSGGNGSETSAPADSGGGTAGGQVEIEFWNVFADDSDTGVFLAEAAEKFMADNPDIKLTIVGQGGYDSVAERLEAAAASDTLPTMAIIEETFLGRFHPLAADLSKYLSADTIANYQQGLLASSYYNGVLMTVPFNRSMPNLFVNRTLFREAGIEKIPTTWEEFEATARQLTDPEKGIYGTAICWDTDAWIFESILYSFGGEIISEDNKTILFGEGGQAVAVVEMFQRMADEGICFNPYLYQDDPWSVTGTAFTEGKVAMFLGSNGVFGMYNGWMQEAGYELEMHMHPAGPGGPSIATGAGNIILFDSASEEQKAAGAKWIEYLAQDENAAAYTLLSGYLPTTYSAVESEAIQGMLAESPSYQSAINQMEYAHRRPLTKNWKAIYKDLTEHLVECMADTSVDAAQSIEEAAANAAKIMEENKD